MFIDQILKEILNYVYIIIIWQNLNLNAKDDLIWLISGHKSRFDTVQSNFNHAYFILRRLDESSFKDTNNQKEEKINQSPSLVCVANGRSLGVFFGDQRRGNHVTPKVFIMTNVSVMSHKGSGNN